MDRPVTQKQLDYLARLGADLSEIRTNNDARAEIRRRRAAIKNNAGLKIKAFEWHGEVCRQCGATDNLDIHHRHYRTFSREQPEDVVVLYRKCHLDLHDRSATNRLAAADIPLVDPEWAEFIEAADWIGLRMYKYR